MKIELAMDKVMHITNVTLDEDYENLYDDIWEAMDCNNATTRHLYQTIAAPRSEIKPKSNTRASFTFLQRLYKQETPVISSEMLDCTKYNGSQYTLYSDMLNETDTQTQYYSTV